MTPQTVPEKVRKRDGSIVAFDASKIERAIERAALEVLHDESRASIVARRVTEAVVDSLAAQYKGKTPHIENIQDTVETALMSEGYSSIAKSYILYRERKSQERFAKSALGLRDDLKLPINTVEVLKRRYLLKDENRRIIETPSELFRRVAHHVAQAEANYGPGTSVEDVEDRFYRMMRHRELMPN
jgi:ribonucleoside-diphosphate reductase alpha chain